MDCSRSLLLLVSVIGFGCGGAAAPPLPAGRALAPAVGQAVVGPPPGAPQCEAALRRAADTSVARPIPADISSTGTLEVRVRNEMSRMFDWRGLVLKLDGEVVFSRIADRAADHVFEPEPLVAFRGAVTSGAHVLEGHLFYRSRPNPYGVFSLSIRSVCFHLRHEERVEVRHDGVVPIDLVAYEKGGVTTPIEDRPAVRIERR